MTTVKIEITDDPASCLRLRREIFMDEQGFPEDEDQHDETAVHLLARNGDRPVGAARIVFIKDTAKIGRVCVVQDARGRGLGAALIRTAMDVARDVPGVTTVRLSAQVRALDFYQGLGFQSEGPEYDDLGVPHQMMVHPL